MWMGKAQGGMDMYSMIEITRVKYNMACWWPNVDAFVVVIIGWVNKMLYPAQGEKKQLCHVEQRS